MDKYNSPEVWRSVPGWDDCYQVSSMGRVKSLERYVRNTSTSFRKLPERILKQDCMQDGYLGVSLSRHQVPKYVKVHRLVAAAFIPNPDNLPVVNHKDGNKHNNCVENLEWCTIAYNNEHARVTGLTPPPCEEFIDAGKTHAVASRKRVMLLETGQIFNSRQEAHEQLGVPLVRIFDSLKTGRCIAGTTFVNVD